MKIFFASLFVLFTSLVAFAQNQPSGKELLTNSTHSANPPTWLTKGKVDAVTDHVQNFLEWDIRRVEVQWYYDQPSFERAHGLGPSVMAVSKRDKNIVMVGPKVGADNFAQVFGHELVHVIVYQKYKDAIPTWLEEGLANFIANYGKVNYKYLAGHAFPADVKDLNHPFSGDSDHLIYHYQASQALAEMLNAKCDLKNLLRLSVGQKMEPYLDTYCRIPDLNKAFKDWVTSKAK